MAINLNGINRWRCIGPFRGGRVVTVAGDVNDIGTFYFGACAGGIWKTTDAGQYWENISDGFLKTSSVGALAVSEVDPNVIYAGMGEATIRIDVSRGDGVYKSTDAGRTWQHVGLADTRHIGKVRIHPQDPDTVFVAALGHAFGNNDERGVFKSTDGGKKWRNVLFKSDKAGAIDLSIDPLNPRIIYAAIWEAYRNFWQISSGGDDSGLWKSSDGGETWTDISRNKGLPEGVLGKIGVSASPAQAGRVFALIENEKGGMYRSDDYGETWEYVAANNNLVSRAWYYTHVTADPVDGDTVYVNNLSLWKSTDGGRNYQQIQTPHGDNHDIWIDPKNPKRMVQGNDGGACVSLNGGQSWSTIFNQPTAQFYHATTDNREPYFIYGTQQDNSSLAVPSRTRQSSITWADGFVAGTGESGYIAVKPDNPNIVYVGAIGSSPGGGNSLQRYDHETKYIRLVTTWPELMSGEGAAALKYRFAWTYPILFSPHDPNTLYAAGNVVFKTTDEGQSWQPISPDLTRADPEKLQPTGGPVNRDSVGAEVYATVFTFAESPHKAGVFWAGSDDGLVHISQDGGANWKNITPKKLPDWTMISMLEPSPHDAATCYMAATRYKLDDYAPHLYKTSDYGKTWKRINDGIPSDDFTRIIRCDPTRAGLLYAGTESGVYISFDDGANWHSFQMNLPVTPIHDLLVKNNDLIAATHGRSFWILDDLTTVQQLSDDVQKQAAHLLKPRTTARILPSIHDGRLSDAPGKTYMSSMGLLAPYTTSKTDENIVERKFLDSGENPPLGVTVTYFLKQAPRQPITLTFLDADGNVLREFKAKAAKKNGAANGAAEPAAETIVEVEGTEGMEFANVAVEEDKAAVYLTAKAGWNRFVWDLRLPESSKLKGTDPHFETMDGPIVLPGAYQVRLTVGKDSLTQSFDLLKDPAATASDADLQAQFDLLKQMHAKYSAGTEAVNRMRSLRQQLDGWAERLGKDEATSDLAATAKRLKEQVLEIEKVLLHPDLPPGWPGRLNHGMQTLRKLTALPSVVGLGDYPPTQQARDVYQKLATEIDVQITRLDAFVANELAAFNQQIAKQKVAIIGV
jgi:photosystem II stability/assembly factor-like uncharacterized protein